MDSAATPPRGTGSDARQARIDAKRRALENRDELRRAARRRLLIGAVVQRRIEAGLLAPADLAAWLDEALSRPTDRALFGLPPRPSEPGSS